MRSVVVLYDYEQRSPRAIPAALREQFERYRSERA
jgi:acyl-CoA thioesterase FadM